jgi:hypothetical protein
MAHVFKLGCLKDYQDPRDIPMALLLPVVKLPPRLDYAPEMSPVRDQGEEGTCVAFAGTVGVKEYFDGKEYKKYVPLSPRYVYANCKKLDGIPESEGTYPRVAMKVLFKKGACLESSWPYKPYQTDKPKKNADTQALKYRIKAYARLKNVKEMKKSLIVNGPFLGGMLVFSDWLSEKTARDGKVPMPRKNEEELGGHAVCVCGYNDKTGLFKFKNSWGKAWGDGGYGYLKYDYVGRYCLDAWSATDLIENPAKLAAAMGNIHNPSRRTMNITPGRNA